MKVNFDPNFINKKPIEAYKIMEKKITTALKKRESVDSGAFYSEMMTIGDSFFHRNQQEVMNNNSLRFAETLVNMGESKLAGVIYSALIKLNKFNRPLVERLATNALKIAKKNRDTIHIMARADDLAQVYRRTQYGSDAHLKALYTEKRALVEICDDYNSVKERYSSISRQMKPVENYEKMLAAIKVEITEVIMEKSPTDAKMELEGAEQIFGKYGDGRYSQKIKDLRKRLG